MSTTDYARLMNYCMKIMPYAQLYQRQIQYYNKTAYDTLANDIGKILPKFPTDKRQKCGAILTTILGSVASKVIGLAYDLVLTRLYLYYDMKLVTFGIDNQRNLIVQFPVFIQPYTQKRLVMYQIETVPVPILDEINKCTHTQN